MLKTLVVGALVAMAAWFGYEKLRDTDPERLPQPTQVVVPNQPDVSFDLPTP